MAPPINPTPTPQPNTLPHTIPMSAPAAFLIASGSANGKADATFEVTVMLAATTAIERQSVPLDIDISPFFFAYGSHDARKLRRHREYAASVPAYLTPPPAVAGATAHQALGDRRRPSSAWDR